MKQKLLSLLLVLAICLAPAVSVRADGDGAAEQIISISYAANGGGGERDPDPVSAGAAFSLPDCPFTAPEGKRFEAWSIGGERHAAGERCAFSADTTLAAVWASDVQSSGCRDVKKLNPEEIRQLLGANPTTMPSGTDGVFETLPSCAAPYAAGKARTELLQRTADRLNALRNIAGLPPVALDLSLCENAQYGAVLLAASEFSHYPSKPADMDDEFFQLGRSATSSSNIYAGIPLLSTPDGFMDDSDGGNLSRLGHRRWQLNPAMGKIGFGYAVVASGYRYYTAEKVFDSSGRYGDYDFISWPSSGFFPGKFMDSYYNDVAWSVSLNPSKYRTPVREKIKVTLRRESDGTEWSFSGAQTYTASRTGAYFGVDNGGYGVSNCIIFRPDGAGAYDGLYTVTVDGLTDSSGNAAKLRYQVDFFSLESGEGQSYSVRYDANGGLEPAAEATETNGALFSLPSTPTRPGYAFAGWYTAPEGGSEVTESTPVSLSADATLYAHWVPQAVILNKGTAGANLTWRLLRSGEDRLLSFTGAVSADAPVYVAEYLQSGQMCALSSAAASGGTVSLSGTADTVRLFHVSAGNFIPLSASAELKNDN